tara:strand:- start:503 stop:1321 length:819 start_codon:yes stop_codon:yes gene_type:complete
MNLKQTIKQKIISEALRNHIWIEKTNSKVELENFINRFKEKYVFCELIRIGGQGDGGYLIPNNLKDISYCYSPGVDYTATFEKELSDKYNIKSFMADASVDKAPISGPNFQFLSKYLGSFTDNKFITLSDWLYETSGENVKGKILQMDIEGGEYDVLIYEDGKTLSSFSTMVIEFHSMEQLYKKTFLKMISSIFEKIYKYFSICHVHPNNCCGLAELDGILVPRIMEITFIRNDYIDKSLINKKIVLPNILDKKNMGNMDDIIMPEIWWKKD